MRFSGVGITQLQQLADAMVGAQRQRLAAGTPSTPRCFGLVGTLGAGKTRLCQEIARACGVDPAEVTSPTFTLLKSYPCRDEHGSVVSTRKTPIQLHHLDLYRIADEDELWELGLDELTEAPGSWTLIEWADRFSEALPSDTIWIHIRLSSQADRYQQTLREIEVTCHTSEQSDWLAEVRARFDGRADTSQSHPDEIG